MKKMKKIIPATMAGAMIFGMGVPALAATPSYEGDAETEVHGELNDEVQYESDGANGLNADVPVDGRINRATVEITPDPNPEEIISAQVSTEAVMWWVPSQNGQSYTWNNNLNRNRSDLDGLDPDGYNGYNEWVGLDDALNGAYTEQGKVYSPDYTIRNIGTSDLDVDLVGFYDSNRFSASDSLNSQGIANQLVEPTQLTEGTREYAEYGNLDLVLKGLAVGGVENYPLVVSNATADAEDLTAGAAEGIGSSLSVWDEDGEYFDSVLDYGYDSNGDANEFGTNEWVFAIGGQYTGQYYGEELQFDHSMVLNFSINYGASR